MRRAAKTSLNAPAFAPFAGLVALCAAVYGDLLRGSEFVWDDQQFVVSNVFLTSTRYLKDLLTKNLVAGVGQSSNLYRPLQLLTHFVDVQLWGLEPWAHHLTNVALQMAAACALFAALRRLFRAQRLRRPDAVAWGLTALFAVHPLQSALVGYVSGRGDVLAVLFLSLTLLCLGSARLWPLAFPAFAAAFLSKESALVFPPLFLAYDALTRGRPLRRADYLRHASLFALAGAYLVLRLTVLRFGDLTNFYGGENALTQHWGYRICTYLSTLPKFLELIFWPADTHHERSWQVYTSLGAPLVLAGAALWALLAGAAGFVALSRRHRAPLVAFGLGWLLLVMLPTSNLLFLINSLFYDHWMVLPMIGVWIAAAPLVDWLPPRAAALAGALALLAAIPFTIRENEVWKTRVSLYEYILEHEPHSAKIMNNLAMELSDRGDLQRAKELYLKSIAESDTYPQTHHNLGLLYFREGDREKAKEQLQIALRMDRRFYYSYTWLGMIALSEQKKDLAAEYFTTALQIHPDPMARQGLFEAREKHD